MEEDAGAGVAGLASEQEAGSSRPGSSVNLTSTPLGDLRCIPHIVKQLKNRGLLHSFSPNCPANVDTKPEPEAESG